MPRPEKNKIPARKGTHAEMEKKLKPYVGITLAILILAALSVLIVPRGTPLQRCMSAIFGKEQCIQRLAYSSSNSSMCKYLPSTYSDSCYYAIAVNSTDSGTCHLINDSSLRSGCFYKLATALNRYQLCSNLNSSYRSNCIFNISVAESNQSLCTYIYSNAVQSVCHSTIEFNYAVSLSKPAYCANITSNNDSNTTLALYQNTNPKQSHYSGSADLGSVLNFASYSNISIGARDFCYTALASQTSNSGMCGLIQSNVTSGICRLVTRTGNIIAQQQVNYTLQYSQCNNSSDIQSCRDNVGFQQAVQTENISLCGNLSTQLSYQCYSVIAQLKNETADCNYIGNASARNACLLNFHFKSLVNSTR